ncbi:hypothetical protein MM213_20400, partial [Belliella sp. R4-6]
EGTKVYTYTYEDCAGETYTWTYTYTIETPVVTIPTNGSATVACVGDAVEPSIPTVTDNCGRTIVPTLTSVSDDPACEGTKVYTYTYTDCAAEEYTWTYTYTIETPVVTIPTNGSATVACVGDAVEPSTPAVTDNCGRTIVPTLTSVSDDPTCEGTKVYTYTYTDCAGEEYIWTYTYTIETPVVTMPLNGSETVTCVDDAVEPNAPAVTDNCGRTIVPTLTSISEDPACEGTKVYTYTYTDCAGEEYIWTFTYTIEAPVVTIPTNGSETVSCVDHVVEPTAPEVTDNCGRTIVPTLTSISEDPACEGTKVYTYTYTDCAGEEYIWTYTYTIETPVVTMPLNGSSTVACVDDAVEPTAPEVTDNCGRTIVPTLTSISEDPACEGTKVYTYTYTDCSGEEYTWTFTYTIEAPEVTIPTNGSETVACVDDAVEPTAPEVKDNCGREIIPTLSVVSEDPACEGTKVYTYTYTDCAGEEYIWTFTYTIEAPVVTIPTNGSETVSCVDDAVEPNAPTVTDNCGREIIPTLSVVSEDPACEGTKVYTYTYEDCAGETYTWTYTYTIETPVVTMPLNGSASVACVDDAVEPNAPAITDNCDRTIVPTLTSISEDPACEGTKVYTYTYTDCAGEEYTWTYTYTIEAPVVTIPTNGSATVACVDDAVEQTAPEITDNCDRTIVPTLTSVSDDPACEGTKVYTYTYTDCAGEEYTWTYTYTIETPVVTMPLNGSASVACVDDAVEPNAPTVTDNCGRTIVPTLTNVSDDPTCEGTKVYTYTYTDCAGEEYTWTFTYTIEAPVVTMPLNGSATVACVDDAVEPTAPEVTDNCGRTIVPTLTSISEDPACEGTKVYTYTYEDCAGNIQDWTFTYTIEAPVVTMPLNGSATVACVDDAVEPNALAVTDNCDRTIVPTLTSISDDPACEGTKVYTYTYEDCAGETYTWTFTYTIEAPVVAIPTNGSETVACVDDAVESNAPAVTDNCGRTIVPTLTNVSEDPACEGTKVYTYTYEDCAGETYTWTFTYTIEAPVVTMPLNGSATLACVDDAVEPNAPTVTDNCGRTIVPTLTNVSEDPACEGTKVYTYTYTDCSGEEYTWTFTYTIEAPVVTMPTNGSATVACVDDAVEPTAPEVTDNCGRTIVPTLTSVSEDPACEGTKVYTYAYTDCAGEEYTWTFTYTIEAPVVTIPTNGSETVSCVDDAVEPNAPTVTDNCDREIIPTLTSVSEDPACEGTKVYTYTYTDCAGEEYTWTYTYTIETPVVTMPLNGSATVACVDDAVEPTAPEVTDNCDRTIVPTLTSVSEDPACEGTKVYTYTYEDCAGETYTWTYTYTIEAPVVTMPTNGSATVACADDAVEPTAPEVTDNCGRTIVPTLTSVSDDPACEGTKVYTYTYTDCAGEEYIWTFTYTIEAPVVTMPLNGSATVA